MPTTTLTQSNNNTSNNFNINQGNNTINNNSISSSAIAENYSGNFSAALNSVSGNSKNSADNSYRELSESGVCDQEVVVVVDLLNSSDSVGAASALDSDGDGGSNSEIGLNLSSSGAIITMTTTVTAQPAASTAASSSSSVASSVAVTTGSVTALSSIVSPGSQQQQHQQQASSVTVASGQQNSTCGGSNNNNSNNVMLPAGLSSGNNLSDKIGSGDVESLKMGNSAKHLDDAAAVLMMGAGSSQQNHIVSIPPSHRNGPNLLSEEGLLSLQQTFEDSHNRDDLIIPTSNFSQQPHLLLNGCVGTNGLSGLSLMNGADLEHQDLKDVLMQQSGQQQQGYQNKGVMLNNLNCLSPPSDNLFGHGSVDSSRAQSSPGNGGNSLWSNGIDEPPMMNGYSGYTGYGGSSMYNTNAISPHQRRAITGSNNNINMPNGNIMGGSGTPGGMSQYHPGLSPNNHLIRGGNSNNNSHHQQQQQSQQQHQNPHHQQQSNMFKNTYPQWSNPAPSMPQGWPNNGNGPNPQSPLNAWNRGRSVPNLNPIIPPPRGLGSNNVGSGNKPTSPMQQQPGTSNSPFGSSSLLAGVNNNIGAMNMHPPNTPMSPSKYRRSTSYPGKMPGGGQGATSSSFGLDITGMDENRDIYQPYQDRIGMGNGLDMRSLEHCLSDIMRGVDAGSLDSMKGFQNCNLNTLQSLAQLHGKPFFHGLDDHIPEEAGGGFIDNSILPLNSPARSSPHSQGSDSQERFSRKVFVGGLPPDIDEDEITASFRRFGPLVVDWPHKAESKSYFPPKGYAFLLFQDESSVQQLIESCITDDDKLYLCVSSPTIKDKPVQIRPWRLSDADYVLNGSMALDPRKTVFVGGVPRPLRASELAMIMDRLYGGVCYAGIDTDPELKYPKGAGRVAFSNQQSYISAISARFVQLQHIDIDKRVEVKPYVLDDQMCDECQGQLCGGKYAPFFCANVICLQYYCEQCWITIHSKPGREYHKPLVKEGADRPRAVPFRWC